MAISTPNNSTVLITGINGYIASVLGMQLLEAGYSIRGTTRRLSSADPLLEGPYAPYIDRVKIYEVPDMTVSGAFDEAVKGVHGIFHTASPIDFTLTTYAQMVTPAVDGTNTLLISALKAGPQLKAVVVTSSVIAVTNPRTDYHVFTEADFASEYLAQAQLDLKEGRQTHPGVLYGASKTAADQAVWKFLKETKPAFAISTINPAVVVGPPVYLPKTGDKLNETLRPIWSMLSGNAKTIPDDIGSASWVDVRDVAYMHIWAFEHPEKSNGERYIGCVGIGPWQAHADITRAYFKEKGEEQIVKNIPLGNPGEGYVGYNKETGIVERVELAPDAPRVSGEKAPKEMGFTYKSLAESTIATAEAIRPLL
ncbi:48775d96-b4dd-4517-ba77-da740819e717 [Sclerotinia trifoliorum]|uniref:48775d96-b4dd-4517-ba77-da740819e717 n=1 Tax=Sclerotinia trifoliorum TaxID=28548 RepID=A0A8H2VSN3_9HELO|nr:48775d96-b4dd-4517-ba77-da740819e717 [Sclerotinia trifoliorum]